MICVLGEGRRDREKGREKRREEKRKLALKGISVEERR